MKKIGFVVLAHYSKEFRPDGHKFIDDYIKTFIESYKYPHEAVIYLIDNGSEKQYDWEKWEGVTIKYHYIENQFVDGITGGWNKGIDMAFNDGCNIICMTNDDILYNESINYFIDYIDNNNTVNTLYGPLSNGILGHYNVQKADKPINKIYTLAKGAVLNGFFFAFTRGFYENFRFTNHELFATKHKHNGGDGKWGGQEGEFIRFTEQGAVMVAVGTCWIHHHKTMGYRKTRDYKEN